MDVRSDRRYTDEHEWVLEVSPGRVRVGITHYAQDALGDVVFVDLPEAGAHFDSGATVAELESTKSVAEVYAPVEGDVVAVNDRLAASPELINEDPYGEGWMFELDSTADLGHLLDAEAYRDLTED